MNHLKTGQLAERHGVTPQTIRRWIKDGRFEHVTTTQGGQFRVRQVADETIGYTRVSSAKQRTSLKQQTAEIRRKHKDIAIVSDIGSGFNFKRRQFVKLLERSLRGDAIRIVVSDRDRLARVGFEFVRFVVEASGGSIEVIHQDDGKHESFNVVDLVGFITSFCNSYYGKRGARRKKDSTVSKQ